MVSETTTLSEIQNDDIRKNLQSFLEIISVQKEVVVSRKLQDFIYQE